MQFSLPQFTDVEDRLVANLSFKQFGIIFGTAIFVFIVFTLSKSVALTIAFAIVLGIPALVVAFGKINGRPIYSAFGSFISYFLSPKVYVFHKEANAGPEQQSVKVEIKKEIPAVSSETATVRIKQLNYLLQQQAAEEQVLLERIKNQPRAK